MKNLILILIAPGLFFLTHATSIKTDDFDLRTRSLKIVIDKKGYFRKLVDLKTGKNYLASDTPTAVMTIGIKDDILQPRSAVLKGNSLTLGYKNNIEANIKIGQKESHITFELESLSDDKHIRFIIWGPYATTINKVIGETIGVVQGTEFAIGIQALNPKTLGGYPWRENDCMPQIDIFEQNDPSDLCEEGKRYVLYRVEAAKPTNFGSTLQTYCRNRNTNRIIENEGHKKYVAPAFDDGGCLGSRIALFGCPVDKTLETIGKIELAEKLPHPLVNGQWGKTAPGASAAYIIMGFGEDNIKKAIEITKKAGLKYLYHPGPFESWGHFKLNRRQFPNGPESMKKCVDIAKKNGIALGVHTLSNFISTNDPYVTPVPDKRLAKVGATLITQNISDNQTEIPIKSPDFFNQYQNNHLKTVKIDYELIRYGGVSENKPWKLLDCRRGAFGTKTSAHKKGSTIDKLADHAYKVFLTNSELSKEVAENIADLFNSTGLRQISFDGLEGNRSTGMGNYGEIIFAKAWYDKINDAIKSHYIADASRTTHYFWHIFTRMNWGEPWYAGFRESQTEYRLKNQKYFKRNLIPGMLGWFLMTPQTSMEDIEWLLARSAAYDAGFAFVTNYGAIEQNGHSDKILQLIRDWEKLRMSGVFTDEQKQRMKNTHNEFTLKKTGDNTWNLYQVFSTRFVHKKKQRQPGEPLYSTFNLKNKGNEQTLHFILSASGADVSDIKMEINHYKEITLPLSLHNGESIKYSGGTKAYVYDKNHRRIDAFDIDPSVFKIANGTHSINFDCQFSNTAKEPTITLEIKTYGNVEKLVLK